MISASTAGWTAGRMTPPPDWATSGAIVGVRGSSARIRGAVTTLVDAGAHVAAVLVRDGGNRTRYPDWDKLVAELQALTRETRER